MNRLVDRGNSAERTSFGRRRLLLALTGTLVLPACGWKPLYERPGASVNSGGAGTALAQIWIDPVEPQKGPSPLGGDLDALYDSRAAQLLQNYLKEALNPYGPPNPGRYHLGIQLIQQTRSAASLGDGTTTREDLIMAAEFQLFDPTKVDTTKKTKAAPKTETDPETLKKRAKEEDAANGILLRDQTKIVTSYDILREPYADLTSRRDAQQRAAQQIAEAIQTRLAAFLVQ